VASVIASSIGQLALYQVIDISSSHFDLKLTPLFYGAITYVAAYVMGEGRRISDDNAGIV
jgi:hypothetical protein